MALCKSLNIDYSELDMLKTSAFLGCEDGEVSTKESGLSWHVKTCAEGYCISTPKDLRSTGK